MKKYKRLTFREKDWVGVVDETDGVVSTNSQAVHRLANLEDDIEQGKLSYQQDNLAKIKKLESEVQQVTSKLNLEIKLSNGLMKINHKQRLKIEQLQKQLDCTNANYNVLNKKYLDEKSKLKISKFDSVASLEKAYQELEKEFTLRNIKLALYEKAKDSDSILQMCATEIAERDKHIAELEESNKQLVRNNTQTTQKFVSEHNKVVKLKQKIKEITGEEY